MKEDNQNKPESYRVQRVESLIEEFDLELEARCKAIHSRAEDAVLEVRNTLHAQIMRIPRKTRSMPISKFLADVDVACLRAMQGRISRRVNEDDQARQTMGLPINQSTTVSSEAPISGERKQMGGLGSEISEIDMAAQKALMQLMSGEATTLDEALVDYEPQMRDAVRAKVQALRSALGAL